MSKYYRLVAQTESNLEGRFLEKKNRKKTKDRGAGADPRLNGPDGLGSAHSAAARVAAREGGGLGPAVGSPSNGGWGSAQPRPGRRAWPREPARERRGAHLGGTPGHGKGRWGSRGGEAAGGRRRAAAAAPARAALRVLTEWHPGWKAPHLHANNMETMSTG